MPRGLGCEQDVFWQGWQVTVRRHLLIVGRDLNRLVELSIVLGGYASLITLAVTADVIARARWSAQKGRCQIVVCLDKSDSALEVCSLAGIFPRALFLTTESDSHLSEQLKDAGYLVLSASEQSNVIAATLIACGAREVSI